MLRLKLTESCAFAAATMYSIPIASMPGYPPTPLALSVEPTSCPNPVRSSMPRFLRRPIRNQVRRLAAHLTKYTSVWSPIIMWQIRIHNRHRPRKVPQPIRAGRQGQDRQACGSAGYSYSHAHTQRATRWFSLGRTVSDSLCGYRNMSGTR